MNKTNENQNSVTYFENAITKKQKDFIQLQDHCTLCNTSLEIQYLADFECSLVREEAFCPCCDVRTRNKIHSII